MTSVFTQGVDSHGAEDEQVKRNPEIVDDFIARDHQIHDEHANVEDTLYNPNEFVGVELSLHVAVVECVGVLLLVLGKE